MGKIKSVTAKYWGQLILLLVGFFLDGSLKSVLPLLNRSFFQVSVQILLMLLILMVLHNSDHDNQLFWFSLLLGILYDSFYSRIFGLYTVIFPLTVLCTRSVRQYVTESAIFEWSTYFIALTASLIYLYIIGSFLHLTMVNGTHFITDWLGPTLLVNSLVFIVLYWPVTKIIGWLQ